MRNTFNALEIIPDWCKALIDDAEKSGAFTRGLVSDKKNRGSAINTDLYGYDQAQNLCVIQVRQCIFRPGRFNRVRKDYYLIGRTETGNIFAHPVDSPARSKRALSSPEATIKFVLAKIWDCKEDELDQITRQGDIAFIPALLPEDAVLLDNKEIIIRETHKIIADKIYKSGDNFFVARSARAVHTKNQHETIRVKNGFYRVQAGIRASVWGFTAPVGD